MERKEMKKRAKRFTGTVAGIHHDVRDKHDGVCGRDILVKWC